MKKGVSMDLKIKTYEKFIKHRVSSKFIVGMIFCLVALLLITTSIMFKLSVKSNSALERELIYREYANQLIDSSDYLTDKAYYYVSTGEKKYYDDYFVELEQTNTMESAVEGLINLGITVEEQEIITATQELSEKLTLMEIEAFQLVDTGKGEEAQKLIFSEEYEEYVNKIHNNFDALKKGIEVRVAAEGDQVVFLNKITLWISVLVVIGTTIGIILLLSTLLRITKENDIDPLTGVLNRNKYKQRIISLIDKEPTKFGALLFCDIDNLKFINDCYGHNNGDKCIQATANVLREFSVYNSILVRPSGDEFIVYIHGFSSQEEMVSIINHNLEKAKNTFFKTSLNVNEKVRFSTGIAIYPTDTNNVEELIKYADYAMYKMKKNSKGEAGYYDGTSSDKELILAKNSGVLNEFLENEAVKFALQPIVDANTFDVYGYEVLMRPTIETLKSPMMLLELAKIESKLDKVERLTMKKVFELAEQNKEKLGNCKIFINSIADQVLSDKEFAEYVDRYPDILKNVVLEIIEQESVDYNILNRKTEMFKKEGALAAIDDFGSGYNNENSLLCNDYDIIKVDMNLIRNIDIDSRRQYIVNSLIVFSNTHNYKILAEGVETAGEARTLREMGMHYLQGYFIGKPSFEINGISQEAKNFLDEEKRNNKN